MLTGKRAFDGDDVSDALASVLKSEPDWSVISLDVTPAVRTLLQRCLVKDRRHRVADIAVVQFVFAEVSALTAVSGSAVGQDSRDAVTEIDVECRIPHSGCHGAPHILRRRVVN